MPQMNPPSASPRLCHRNSGASIALGGGRGPGDESARPLCSRHFQRTDTTAPVSGCSEVETQAPGRGWAVGPPGCWVPKQGPSPRPARRMAQESFEAYGKSSPLPALLPLPNPPGYVPPPVSMGTGGSRHGTLSTMRRRGDYRRGGNSGLECGTYTMEQGGKAQREPPPPPLQPSASPRGCVVPTSCLRRACNGGEVKREPLPSPDTTAPPRAGNAGREGAKSPPPPRATRQGGEAEVGGFGTSHTTVPVEGARRASPGGGTTGGAGVG